MAWAKFFIAVRKHDEDCWRAWHPGNVAPFQTHREAGQYLSMARAMFAEAEVRKARNL